MTAHPIPPVRRALLSVFDKTGLLPLAQGLTSLGVDLISTGGTARHLIEAGIAVSTVAAQTGSPELLDGRVKTLHPRIHAAILARRDHPDDLATLAEHQIKPIDLVVVNLYPFSDTLVSSQGGPSSQAGASSQPGVSSVSSQTGASSPTSAQPTLADEAAIAQIDIGGPTLIRAAAKNYASVGVVVSPEAYPALLAELRTAGGLSKETRQSLAAAAFSHTAAYDAAIADWFQGPDSTILPEQLHLVATHRQSLRYGENPHQAAALYRLQDGGLPDAQCHQGKALSYNNYLDLAAAHAICQSLTGGPAAVVVKHSNPCGAAVDPRGLLPAYTRALSCDPMSAFGGIVAFNGPVDEATATALVETFLEVVVAPSFSPKALAVLSTKRRLRVVSMPPASTAHRSALTVRGVPGGLLVQDMDATADDLRTAQVVTQRAPTPAERRDLQLAWELVAHVKSNAIVFAHDGASIAVGAGQMSRVDAVRLAVTKAQHALCGSVMASDAFFPFRDGVDAAAAAGATAVVQPGGSRQDPKVIAACNEHGMAMLFTGVRHFRH